MGPGPGLWKHNDKVLKKDGYIVEIETIIKNVLNSKEVQGHCKKWEFMKYSVRKADMAFGKRTLTGEQRRENTA
jgi:hypothetical protein